MKFIKWMLLAFVGLVVIGILAGPKKNAPTTGSTVQAAGAQGQDAGDAQSVELKTTPMELAQAYEDNTVAADQRFKGVRYQVTGRVASIDTDVFGKPYLTLRGGVNEFMEPQFSFDKAGAASLASLHKGDSVTMTCTGSGDVAKVPMSSDCSMM